MLQSLILLVILIFLNATFASAEIAVLSMSETKLKKMAEEGNKKAKKLTVLIDQPSRFLATIQVAITFAGLLQSAFAAESFAGPLVSLLVDAGVTIPESVLKSASIVAITIILGYFNLVFGELVPKRVAMKKSESMALGMSGMLYFVAKAFAPIVWLLTASTNLVIWIMGMNPDEEEEPVTEEEIRMMLVEGNKKGTIEAEENEIIQNVFEFNDISVEEICTHRKEVVLLFAEDSSEKWEDRINETRHTYYPVCGKDKDDILGILNTKDYFRLQDKSKENIMEHVMEPALFIPESMKANVLFQKMKEARTYFAVIIDEYGGLSGIITVHDIMEALVGELEEKEDDEKPKDIEKISEDTWRIQGCADLDEVAEELNRQMPVDTYDTFSGYVCGLIGRVPDEGESFHWEEDGMKIQVQDVVDHIIQETIVQVILEPTDESKEE